MDVYAIVGRKKGSHQHVGRSTSIPSRNRVDVATAPGSRKSPSFGQNRIPPRGELVKAFVVMKRGHACGRDALRAHWPRNIFPKTQTTSASTNHCQGRNCQELSRQSHPSKTTRRETHREYNNPSILVHSRCHYRCVRTSVCESVRQPRRGFCGRVDVMAVSQSLHRCGLAPESGRPSHPLANGGVHLQTRAKHRPL